MVPRPLMKTIVILNKTKRHGSAALQKGASPLNPCFVKVSVIQKDHFLGHFFIAMPWLFKDLRIFYRHFWFHIVYWRYGKKVYFYNISICYYIIGEISSIYKFSQLRRKPNHVKLFQKKDQIRLKITWNYINVMY